SAQCTQPHDAPVSVPEDSLPLHGAEERIDHAVLRKARDQPRFADPRGNAGIASRERAQVRNQTIVVHYDSVRNKTITAAVSIRVWKRGFRLSESLPTFVQLLGRAERAGICPAERAEVDQPVAWIVRTGSRSARRSKPEHQS